MKYILILNIFSKKIKFNIHLINHMCISIFNNIEKLLCEYFIYIYFNTLQYIWNVICHLMHMFWLFIDSSLDFQLSDKGQHFLYSFLIQWESNRSLLLLLLPIF